jgi:hypothetical protein
VVLGVVAGDVVAADVDEPVGEVVAVPPAVVAVEVPAELLDLVVALAADAAVVVLATSVAPIVARTEPIASPMVASRARRNARRRDEEGGVVTVPVWGAGL